MATKKKVLIYIPELNVYLDGYDDISLSGWGYEWTTDRKTAWRMYREEAERRLVRIKERYPLAKIIEP